MKKALKWMGLLLLGVVLILLLAAGTLYVLGGSLLETGNEIAAETLTSPADSAALAHGAYLVSTLGCQDCHGENLGGQVFADAPPFLVSASNLTAGQGGIGSSYTDADWERAIRHGVRPGNTGLLIMPSKAYHALSNNETADLIAYLKTVPAVDNELPKTELRPMGRIIAGTGGLYSAASEIDHAKPHLAVAPPHAPTPEYGAYRLSLCAYCHGDDLHGGPPLDPESPPSPDLFVVTGWTLDQFKTLMRTGVNPNGKELNPEHMPWTAFRNMTDAELEAIHTYLQTLKPASEAI
jgi:mono/diheme cytochrome c family protein